MPGMSTIRRDFVASHLRSQITRLQAVLDNIENEERVDCGYTDESLKEIEEGLRKIRKLCTDN